MENEMKKRYLNTIATGTLESHDCYDKIKHLDYIELESENYKGRNNQLVPGQEKFGYLLVLG